MSQDFSADTGASDPLPTPGSESSEFPVLQHILEDYFPNPHNANRSRDVEFVQNYKRYGESSIEFRGLREELEYAVTHPREAQTLVNETLGLQLTTQEVRGHLVSLHDQITESGAWSPEVIEADQKAEQDAEQERRAAMRADPQQMMDYYLTRPVRLPHWTFLGRLAGRLVPLWGFLVAGFVCLGIAWGLLEVPLPSWLLAVPAAFAAIGLIVVFLTAYTMYGLRDEIQHPDREAKREEARAENRERRAEKRGVAQAVRDWMQR